MKRKRKSQVTKNNVKRRKLSKSDNTAELKLRREINNYKEVSELEWERYKAFREKGINTKIFSDGTTFKKIKAKIIKEFIGLCICETKTRYGKITKKKLIKVINEVKKSNPILLTT